MLNKVGVSRSAIEAKLESLGLQDQVVWKERGLG
jgi:hypothetical protein